MANQTLDKDSSTGDLAFSVSDVETAAGNLTITATSSNAELVPNAPANLVFSGSGSTLITLLVSDGSATALVTNQTSVDGVAFDATAGRLYWKDWLGALRSAQLADGSDIQDLNSSSNRNLALAWMPAQ